MGSWIFLILSICFCMNHIFVNTWQMITTLIKRLEAKKKEWHELELMYKEDWKLKYYYYKYWDVALGVLMDYDLNYKIFLVAISIAAIIIPSLISFSLILIIWESSTMKTELASVFSQMNKMITTLMLFLIVAYWYSIYAFMNDGVRNQYTFEDKMNCDSLLDTFRVHIDYGFAN